MTAPGDLRARILTTAASRWAEDGAAGFSVARIAKQLGVSTASPYRHFPDRDGLLVAVIAHAADDLTAVLADAADAAWPQPVDRLRAAAAAWVRRTRTTRIGLAEFVRPEVERADPALRTICRRPIELVTGLVDAATDAEGGHITRDVLAILHGHATLPTTVVDTQDAGDLAKAAADATIRLLPPARRTRRDPHDQGPPAADQPPLF